MMKKIYSLGLIPTLLLGSTGIAQAAGGHYVVDDAALIDDDRCQVETWYSRADSRNAEFVLMPACNVAGVLDIGVGVARVQEDGGYETEVEFEVKTVFREVEVGGFGWGLAASSLWGDSLGRHQGVTAFVPVSFQPVERLMLNVNAGYAWERDDRNAGIWGVGANFEVTPSLHLIGETYGTHRGDNEFQAGLRVMVGNGAIDLSYGQAWDDGSDNWFTVGFGWEF